MIVGETTIEWTATVAPDGRVLPGYSWNPWLGCTKVSPACDHCYAESWAKRTGQAHLWNGERRRTSEANWRQPIKWNRETEKSGIRRKVFCASLADVFDNQAPEEWRADMWATITITPNLDWLLLTKRPQNIAKMLPIMWGDGWPNVWLGTTAEDQKNLADRAWALSQIPAVVRFLSCEPLLESLNFVATNRWGTKWNVLTGRIIQSDSMVAQTGAFHWVIGGGESGPNARPMHPDWARSIRDQCAAADVPYFHKQNGEWAPGDAFGLVEDGPVTNRNGDVKNWMRRYVVCNDRADRLDAHSFTDHATNLVYRVGKKRAGALLDGREWREMPDNPDA